MTPYILSEMEEIIRLIENGRNFGIFFVITMLQLDAVPYKIMNLIEQRAALNLTEKTDYLSFVGRPYSLEFGQLPSGRGFWAGQPPLHFQFAFIEQSQKRQSKVSDRILRQISRLSGVNN